MTDLPPPYDPTIPYAVGRNAYIDVDGRAVIFTGDDPTLDRDLYLAVAQSTLANFREIFTVMAAIVFPHAPEGGPYHSTPPKIKQLLAEKMAEAKTDATLLGLPLPFAEAVAVWQRSCAHMRLAADLDPDPDRRQALHDLVDKRTADGRAAGVAPPAARGAEERRRGVSTTVEIKDKYLARLYAEAYARFEEGNRLGLQQLANDRMFPSSDKQSTEGERGPVSPLGGRTW